MQFIIILIKHSVLLTLFCFLFSSCVNSELVLVELHPTEIVASQDFNPQPSGKSAFWTITKNATPTTVLMFDNKQLPSSFSGRAVNAIIPKEFYSTPGEHIVYIYDTKTEKKSNKILVVVK